MPLGLPIFPEWQMQYGGDLLVYARLATTDDIAL
jgi:hypothetical protein